MSNEILPLPEINNLISSNNDILNFKFYRTATNANMIPLSLNSDYKDLPVSVLPNGLETSEYIITTKNNIIEYSNTTGPIFKINTAGIYKYDVELECAGDLVGTIGVLLTNSSNVIYKPDVILTKDMTTATVSLKFSAILSHKANDLVKLRFTGGKNVTAPAPPAAINLNISYINLYIEKK
jgi:hypothetical protein